MKINLPQSKENTILKVKKSRTQKFAFNFSFLTRNSKYNLDKNSKTVTKDVRLKLIEKIYALSQDDIITVLSYNKEQGLEKIPQEEVKIKLNPEFTKKGNNDSSRYDDCEDDYWVFRLNKLGRVIGKKYYNIFYIMSIDTSFNQYKH